MEKKKVSIIGYGGWGTALGLLLERIGHEVMMWGVDPEYIEKIKKNPRKPQIFKRV